MFHRLVWLRNAFRKSATLRWVYRLAARLDVDCAAAIAKYSAEQPVRFAFAHGTTTVQFRIDSVERYIGLACPREPKVIGRFINMLREGDMVWDIGANFGFYSLISASRVGASGAVIAFDPHPSCQQEIAANAELNGFAWLTTANVALGANTGTMRLAGASSGIDGTHRIVALDSDESGPSFEVSVVRGDDWIFSNAMPIPNIVKLDVEGAEFDVLTGMEVTISSPLCRAIIAEIHFSILHQIGRDHVPREIILLLKRVGFNKINWIDASHLVATKL